MPKHKIKISQDLQPLPAGHINRNLSGTWIFLSFSVVLGTS